MRGAVLDAGLVGDPVDFPGFAAVVGKGLFEVRGVGVQVGPAKADEDGGVIGSVLRVLREKFADAVFEFADLRRVKDANFLVGPVEAPLMGGGVVDA